MSAIAEEAGTSLLEVLVALVLIAIGALAVAPMFVSSAETNASGADITSLASIATAQMEALRAIPFHALVPGGSLTANVTGYSDTSDPNVVLRWEVIDGGGPTDTRTVRLTAIAVSQLPGQPRDVVLTTLRSR